MQERKKGSITYPMSFFMADSTDHITGKEGLSPTVVISKNGLPFAPPLGAVSELGDGWYTLEPNATDRDTLGDFIIHAEAPGADPFDGVYVILLYSPFEGPLLLQGSDNDTLETLSDQMDTFSAVPRTVRASSIIPAGVVLGPAKTGLTIGYQLLDIDRVPQGSFTTTNVEETEVLGTYVVRGGITVPDEGGYIIWGEDGTDYAEATIEPLVDLDSLVEGVWTHTPRDLTVPVSSEDVMEEANAIQMYQATSYDHTWSSINFPALWEIVLFTMKPRAYWKYEDSEAIIQVQLTNGGDASDGMIVLNGETGEAIDASWATLTGDEEAGTITIEITDDATAEFELAPENRYGIKFLNSDGTSYQPISTARAVVSGSVTLTIGD